MIIVLGIVVVVLAVALVFLLGAQIEMFRNLEQLRETAGLIDSSINLPINLTSAVPSSIGLPARLDREPAAVALFLSDKCSTCRALAAELDGKLPPEITIVLDAGSALEPELTVSYDLDSTRTIIDRERAISSAIKLRTTPAALIIRNGQMRNAVSVPSVRRLYSLLEDLRAGRALDGETPANYADPNEFEAPPPQPYGTGLLPNGPGPLTYGAGPLPNGPGPAEPGGLIPVMVGGFPVMVPRPPDGHQQPRLGPDPDATPQP